MPLIPDQKFSTFQNGGDPTTGDTIVGLRGGINTKFDWVLPSGVDTITGTAEQVLVNGSSGVPVLGDVTLSLPQDIATGSSPTFAGMTLSATPLSGTSGGTGFANTGQTINLASGAAGYILTSDASGNGAWSDSSGYATKAQVQYSAFNYGVDTGVADAYIVDLSPAITSLADGLSIYFSSSFENLTSTPTLTVNGFTAPILNFVGTSVSAGDLGNGNPSYLIYSAAAASWLLQNCPVSTVIAPLLQTALYYQGTDTGAANAYNVTYNYGGTTVSFSPNIGTQIFFSPANNNTTSSTVVVNSFGPVSITMRDGVALPAGAMLTTKKAWLMYGYNSSGTLGWILMNPQGYTGGTVNSGLINQVAYYAAAGTTLSGLTTANNGLLVTSATGVPSIGNTIGASISVTGTVTATTGVTTGVSGSASGLNTFLTSNASATVFQKTKQIGAIVAQTFLQITVPATPYFIAIECFIICSRAYISAVGTSLVEKKYFAIARNGSGSDVVLDSSSGADFVATTTSAGGTQNTTSGATTIVRNGAEANTDPQVVNLTVNPVTTSGSSGLALCFCTISVLGSTTGLVIS